MHAFIDIFYTSTTISDGWKMFNYPKRKLLFQLTVENFQEIHIAQVICCVIKGGVSHTGERVLSLIPRLSNTDALCQSDSSKPQNRLN